MTINWEQIFANRRDNIWPIQKIIDGILHYKKNATSEFMMYTAEELTNIICDLKIQNTKLESDLKSIMDEEDF